MLRHLLTATSVGFLGLASLACRADPADDAGSTGAESTTGSSSVDSTGVGGAGGGAVGTGGDNHTLLNEATILTWNLEAYPLTPLAETKAVAYLESLQPDLVALQEIAEPEAFDALVERLEDYDGVLNDDPGAWLRVGLLWRKDRVTVDAVDTLFSSDWYAFPRPPLKARVTIDAPTPIDFVTVVLHLKAQLDAESQDRRRTACERLDTWVRAEIESGDERDYVLVGDFNDKLTDPAQWNVFGAFLDAPDDYRFLTLAAEEAGGHTYIPFESFIDHVLVTSDALGEVGSGETTVLALDEEVSDYRELTDHRPVQTRLVWEPN